MGYGGFEELLESSEKGIRDVRRVLQNILVELNEGHTGRVRRLLKQIDNDLLNLLSDYSVKEDGISIDGKSKVEPDWVHNS